MQKLSTEILRDAKRTIVYQRIIIILLIILLISITLYKFPEGKETEPNQVQHISEAANYTPITPMKPAEYGRAKFKKFRFGTT